LIDVDTGILERKHFKRQTVECILIRTCKRLFYVFQNALID
jgi:hypothetical protein